MRECHQRACSTETFPQAWQMGRISWPPRPSLRCHRRWWWWWWWAWAWCACQPALPWRLSSSRDPGQMEGLSRWVGVQSRAEQREREREREREFSPWPRVVWCGGEQTCSFWACSLLESAMGSFFKVLISTSALNWACSLHASSSSTSAYKELRRVRKDCRGCLNAVWRRRGASYLVDCRVAIAAQVRSGAPAEFPFILGHYRPFLEASAIGGLGEEGAA
jgi:hypothetical protein